MHRITDSLAYFLLIFSSCFLILILYWSAFPRVVTTIHNEGGVFTVLNEDKIVQRGEYLKVNIKFTKHVEAKVESTQHIECKDGNLVTLLPATSNTEPGSHDVIIDYNVPHKTSLGWCKMVFVNEYFVNPIRTVTARRETESFYVVE